jgi:hypothetical protein
MRDRLRIVFMGSPDFAVPCLEALIKHHHVVAVVTQPDRPKGREEERWPPRRSRSPPKSCGHRADAYSLPRPCVAPCRPRAATAAFDADCIRGGRLWPDLAAEGAGAAAPRLRQRSWLAAASAIAAPRRSNGPCSMAIQRAGVTHHAAWTRGWTAGPMMLTRFLERWPPTRRQPHCTIALAPLGAEALLEAHRRRCATARRS